MSQEYKDEGQKRVTISDILRLFLDKEIVVFLPQGHKIRGKLSSVEKDHILIKREISKFRLRLKHIALLDESAAEEGYEKEENLIILTNLPYPLAGQFPTTWTLTAKKDY